MKVSIIVPVYNVEKYITRCVESLINQTLEDIQIILVDDGSKDQSGKLCDEYADKDNRIFVIHKENEGQGIARNQGLEMAEGKYVCFVDSDDYVEAFMCEKLFYIMENENADMCTFGYEIDSPDGKIVRVPRIRNEVYENDKIKNEFSLHFFGDDPNDDNLRGFSSCMSCFRLEVIKDNHIRFQSEREVLSEDNLFCLALLNYLNKVVTTSEVFYHYVRKIDSFSQGYMPERMDMTKILIKKLMEYAAKYGIEGSVTIRIAGLIWINLMSTIKQNVRRVGVEINIWTAFNDISCLCGDRLFIEYLRNLVGLQMSKKQKLFLWSFLHKKILLIYIMAQIRANIRI